jgi:hypothetical protein
VTGIQLSLRTNRTGCFDIYILKALFDRLGYNKNKNFRKLKYSRSMFVRILCIKYESKAVPKLHEQLSRLLTDVEAMHSSSPIPRISLQEAYLAVFTLVADWHSQYIHHCLDWTDRKLNELPSVYAGQHNLALAAYLGNEHLVRELLSSSNKKITDKMVNYFSLILGPPLWAAVLGKQYVVANIILEKGGLANFPELYDERFSLRNRIKYTLFETACQAGSEFLSLLIHKAVSSFQKTIITATCFI